MNISSTYKYYRTVWGYSVRDALNTTASLFNVTRADVARVIA